MSQKVDARDLVKQIHQKKYDKITLVILSLLLFVTSKGSFAWQHPVHRLAVDISYNSLPKDCKKNFDINDLKYGSTESDLYRHLLINPSHKHDRWRIEKSYEAALEASDTNPSLANRRVARAFHYILDQSEPLDKLRKKLWRKWEIDSRKVGYSVLLRDATNMQFKTKYSRNKLMYSSYNWSKIKHEVTLINDRFSKVIRDVLRTARNRNDAYVEVRRALFDYFASTLALQNHLMHRYCAEKKSYVGPIFSDFNFGDGKPFQGNKVLGGVSVTLVSTNTEPYGKSSFRNDLTEKTATVTIRFSKPITEFHLKVSRVQFDEFLTGFSIGDPKKLSGNLIRKNGKITVSRKRGDFGSGALKWTGINTKIVRFNIGGPKGTALAVDQFGILPPP